MQLLHAATRDCQITTVEVIDLAIYTTIAGSLLTVVASFCHLPASPLLSVAQDTSGS